MTSEWNGDPFTAPSGKGRLYWATGNPNQHPQYVSPTAKHFTHEPTPHPDFETRVLSNRGEAKSAMTAEGDSTEAKCATCRQPIVTSHSWGGQWAHGETYDRED